jgi:membrane protein DedA with SNARE-associated domain
MNVEYLVTTYGYWAILLGTFFEGETILVVGGFFAHLGYLKLPYVMAVALIGSFAGDQFFFILGRLKGQKILSKFKKAQNRVHKIHVFMHRYNNWIMFGFRFIYGIRILTPIVIGTNHKISTRRFIILNALGALIWSTVISAGGYLFGQALEIIIKDIRQYQLLVIAGIILLGSLGWLFHRFLGKNR